MGGTGYSSAMMPEPSRLMAALRHSSIVALALLLASCASHPSKPVAAASATPKGESESLMAAEMALRAGDCREASENYLAAASVSKQASVAARAAQIALGCYQLQTA